MPGLEQKLRDVFISYSSDDYSFVSRVNEVLCQRGLETFFDKLDLLPGKNWLDELTEKLSLSRVTVIFFTRTALESQWVKYESQKALKRAVVDKTRHVIPVLLQDVRAEELPDYLDLQQALNLTSRNLSDKDDIYRIGLDVADRVFELLPDAGLPIPFVVFAMNKQEAEDLVSGKALKDAARRDQEMFDYISERLDYPKQEIPDYYNESRDQWRPPFYPPDKGKTIRNTIGEVIGLINKQVREESPELPAVYPQFFSEDFLSDDGQKRLDTFEFLKKRRFVLIIDSLSLFHPTLNERFLVESGFGQSNYKTVRIVVPPPQREVLLPVSRDIEQALGRMLKNLYNRFDLYLDTLYEFSICNERGLRRWIFSSLEYEVSKSITKAERAEGRAKRSFRDEVRG